MNEKTLTLTWKKAIRGSLCSVKTFHLPFQQLIDETFRDTLSWDIRQNHVEVLHTLYCKEHDRLAGHLHGESWVDHSGKTYWFYTMSHLQKELGPDKFIPLRGYVPGKLTALPRYTRGVVEDIVNNLVDKGLLERILCHNPRLKEKYQKFKKPLYYYRVSEKTKSYVENYKDVYTPYPLKGIVNRTFIEGLHVSDSMFMTALHLDIMIAEMCYQQGVTLPWVSVSEFGEIGITYNRKYINSYCAPLADMPAQTFFRTHVKQLEKKGYITIQTKARVGTVIFLSERTMTYLEMSSRLARGRRVSVDPLYSKLYAVPENIRKVVKDISTFFVTQSSVFPTSYKNLYLVLCKFLHKIDTVINRNKKVSDFYGSFIIRKTYQEGLLQQNQTFLDLFQRYISLCNKRIKDYNSKYKSISPLGLSDCKTPSQTALQLITIIQNAKIADKKLRTPVETPTIIRDILAQFHGEISSEGVVALTISEGALDLTADDCDYVYRALGIDVNIRRRDLVWQYPLPRNLNRQFQKWSKRTCLRTKPFREYSANSLFNTFYYILNNCPEYTTRPDQFMKQIREYFIRKLVFRVSAADGARVLRFYQPLIDQLYVHTPLGQAILKSYIPTDRLNMHYAFKKGDTFNKAEAELFREQNKEPEELENMTGAPEYENPTQSIRCTCRSIGLKHVSWDTFQGLFDYAETFKCTTFPDDPVEFRRRIGYARVFLVPIEKDLADRWRIQNCLSSVK